MGLRGVTLRISVKTAVFYVSSINKHRFKSSPGFQELESHIRLAFTPEFSSLKRGFANHWGLQTSVQEESLRVSFLAFKKH